MANDIVNSITTDPTDRVGVMQDQNELIVRRAQNADRRNAQLSAQTEIINAISNDVNTKKAVFAVGTAREVQQATDPLVSLIDQQTDRYIETTTNFRSVYTELLEAQQAKMNPDLPWKEKKQAIKKFDELNQYALELHDARQVAAQQLQTTAQTRATLTQEIVASRQVEEQTQFDIDSFQQMQRAEGLAKRLQAEQTMENVSNNLILNLRTVTAEEAARMKQENSGFTEFLYFGVHQGQRMDQLDAAERTKTLAMFESASRQTQENLAPVMALYDRYKATEQNPNYKDFMSVLVKTGKAKHVQAYLELTGNRQLNELLRVGGNIKHKEIYDNLKDGHDMITDPATGKLVPDGDEYTPPSNEDLARYRAMASEQVSNAYASELIQAAQSSVEGKSSIEVKAAGQSIYKPFAESKAPVVDPANFSGRANEVLNSPEFKALLTQPNLKYGDAQLGTSEAMFNQLTQQGVKEREAYEAVAEVNRSAKSRYVREFSDTGEAQDFISSLGIPATGELPMTLPSGIIRKGILAGMNEQELQTAKYNGSDPADLQAALEALKAITRRYETSQESKRRVQQLAPGMHYIPDLPR